MSLQLHGERVLMVEIVYIKGELYLDNGDLAAVAESEFVEIRKS